MVHTNGNVDTTPAVKGDQIRHIQITVVVEGLPEAVDVAGRVPEMHEEDLVGKVGNDLIEIFAHDVKVCLAHRDPEVLARHDVPHGMADVLVGRHDPGNAAKLRQGRIVRVQGKPHAVLFGVGDYRPEKVGVIRPELFFADLVIVGRHEAFFVKAGNEGASPFGNPVVRAKPADVRHEIEADRPDVKTAHKLQHPDHLFDRGVPLRIALLDVVVQVVGHRLYHHRPDPEVGETAVNRFPVGSLRDVEIRVLRQAYGTVPYAALHGKIPGGVVRTVKIIGK